MMVVDVSNMLMLVVEGTNPCIPKSFSCYSFVLKFFMWFFMFSNMLLDTLCKDGDWNHVIKHGYLQN